MTDELIDIYDEKMNHLGTATREQAHREGLWHKTFHCWIVQKSPQGRAQVLLQVRGRNQNHPSLIDISSAGHIAAGTDPKTNGLENINKELGLSVTADQLIKLFTDTHVYQKNNYINHEFTPTYLLESPTPLIDYKLNPEAVDGVFVADVEDMLNLFRHKVEQIFISGVISDNFGQFTPHTGAIRREDFVPHTDTYYLKVMEAIQRHFKGLNVAC